MAYNHQSFRQMKIIHIPAVQNHQNDKIYAMNIKNIPLNERLMFQRHKPVSNMVWGRKTTTDQKTFFFFIDEGVKVNQHIFLKMLK